MPTLRNKQYITVPFKNTHRGVDLRTWTGAPGDSNRTKVPCILTEDSTLLRIVYQKKWGYTFVFRGLETSFTLKYIHMVKNDSLIIGKKYNAGYIIGNTGVTDYMTKSKLWDHLHFETWKKFIPRNPVKYFTLKEIEVENNGA